MSYPHFKCYTRQDILNQTRLRRFETKLGEQLQHACEPGNLADALARSSARYVIIGIPEDIGVKANYGKGGADSTWNAFLSSFLNTQSNDFLSGENILLLGHFNFNDLKQLIEKNAQSEEERLIAYRHAVSTIDDEVESLVKIITQHDKIPIVIGGGHNNAYPLIKGAAKGYHKTGLIPLAQINCINLDAHTDYRPTEGRHSGNGFRYAEEDGYLLNYFALCVHESYIPQNVLIDFGKNPFMDIITYEDIFIHEEKSFMQAVACATKFTEDNYTGIELDLDCIANTLSSATTPCGISPVHARQYINFVATDLKVAYLHICEGAVALEDGRTDANTGKLISYLVSDFVKSHQL